ncbi:activating signal cointegrator 1 complex subunit 2 homolog [Anopheles moucheti]|uniref:activating signal cointegrator 1 complex subunit 2 homolog n=1 Tax=Anopheles moucheti TaxID=186751 RepID=UPI0022F14338|nr:activating signal cointegrator 1 complex subunit 2 homolog [Anopheles moucheti]
MQRYVALVAFLAVAVTAEAPYPASGWRPEGAQFRLPTEYGAPLLLLQPQPQRVNVQITRENVQFAGRQVAQEQPTSTTVEPVTQPSPVTSSTTEQDQLDPLKVQGLPSDRRNDFQQRANLRQQVVNRPLTANFAQRPLLPVNGQLRALPAVRANVFQQQVVQPQPQVQPQAAPAETYGPPEQEEEQQQPEEQPATTEQPQVPQDENEDDYDEDGGRTVVAVSNSFSGQYYILSPDNTLQRVVFSTMVTDEDRQVNGFSAQLKYSPVDPIRDPVYTYDEQGQLVRIYKK